MLQVLHIRNHKEEVITKLAVKNFDAKETIDEVIALDEQRRKTQAELDNTLAESNKLSKEIGMLYKSGNVEQAKAKKAETADLKEKSQKLNQVLSSTENELKEQRSELLKNIKEGSVIEGKVKNITDYGAFIDLGGIDGLVHVTDISWTKINNPSVVLELNKIIKVKVLKFDEELSRLSLGIKQLTENPWDKVNENIKGNEKILAKVINMNDSKFSFYLGTRQELMDLLLNEQTTAKVGDRGSVKTMKG